MNTIQTILDIFVSSKSVRKNHSAMDNKCRAWVSMGGDRHFDRIHTAQRTVYIQAFEEMLSSF